MIVKRNPMQERVPPRNVIVLAQDPGTFCAVSGTSFQRSGLMFSMPLDNAIVERVTLT